MQSLRRAAAGAPLVLLVLIIVPGAPKLHLLLVLERCSPAAEARPPLCAFSRGVR